MGRDIICPITKSRDVIYKQNTIIYSFIPRPPPKHLNMYLVQKMELEGRFYIRLHIIHMYVRLPEENLLDTPILSISKERLYVGRSLRKVPSELWGVSSTLAYLF